MNSTPLSPLPADSSTALSTALPDWDTLLATATIGTDRRGGTDDAAGALLDDAAVAVLSRRAGVLPLPAAATAPAPDEQLPVVPARAAQRLDALLAESGDLQLDLLAEWLDLAVRAGGRVPAELLPALLDAGRRRRDLRPALVAAGGRRASWLAPQNPEWSYLDQITDESAAPGAATAPEAPALWAEGSVGQRAGYLTGLRRRDPAGALALLRDEWGGIGPDERPVLLGALAVGLSPVDEEFLEAGLDDRRKEVRALAAQLLGRLPDSAYCRRMAERALSIVDTSGKRIQVTPPTGCDKAMRRDGVPAKPPANSGVGERAYWLREILARTPLSVWPADLLHRADDEWGIDLRMGLARAAGDQGDEVWADRIFAAGGGTATPAQQIELASLLYPVLSPATRLRAATGALRDGDNPDPATRVLTLCPAPWPAELAADVFAALARFTRNHYVEPLCRLAALRLPPALADAAEQVLAAADPDSYQHAPIRRMARTLRLRLDMSTDFLGMPTVPTATRREQS